jgi:hypothetical protein
MYYTRGTIKFINGNKIWIKPEGRYHFQGTTFEGCIERNFLILDNPEDCMVTMKPVDTEFNSLLNKQDLNILMHLSGHFPLTFAMNENFEINEIYRSGVDKII